ncbi:hypothetical protein D3C84_654450 [compost metagenome]
MAVTIEHDDLDLAIRQAQANGAGPALSVAGVARCGAGAFGQAVAFDDFQSRAGFELTDQFHGHGGRPAQGKAQARDIDAVVGDLGQCRIDGRDAAETADPVSLHQLPEILDEGRIAIALRTG